MCCSVSSKVTYRADGKGRHHTFEIQSEPALRDAKYGRASPSFGRLSIRVSYHPPFPEVVQANLVDGPK